jgi:hypothetical protein
MYLLLERIWVVVSSILVIVIIISITFVLKKEEKIATMVTLQLVFAHKREVKDAIK